VLKTAPNRMESEGTTPAPARSAMMETFCNARGPGWGRGAVGRHPSFKLVKPSDVGNLKPSLLPELPKTPQTELMQPQSQTPQTSACSPVLLPLQTQDKGLAVQEREGREQAPNSQGQR